MKERCETFTVLITKIGRSIRKIKNQRMVEYALRSPQISCLYYLYLSEGLTATDLCERCEEDKATISRSLDYLEENGYVIRGAKFAKNYKAPLALTEKGRKVGGEIAEKIEGVLQEVGSSLTEEERLIFYRSLSVIAEDLERICKKSAK